jgi:TRAP-type mannitol/chloroaromatic compound transport system permease small subunit
MRVLLRIAEGIDTLSERSGRLFIWLTLLMVLTGSFTAIARFITQFTDLQLTSNLYFELQWYLFSVVFLMTGAYALKHNAHVRVDVLFSYLAPRTRSWITTSIT